MTAHSRSPAFVIVDSHSAYGLHKSQFCLKDFFPVSSGHAMGTATAHDGSNCDLVTAIDDLLGVISVVYLPTTVFDLATVYTQALPTGPAFPQAQYVPTQVGVSSAGGPHKATETIFVMRTAAFNIVKLVMMDSPVGAAFDPLPVGAWGAPENDILVEFGAMNRPWVGFDGERPATGVKITYNLNQKLRKEYRMT
jgi:hypothetical protein